MFGLASSTALTLLVIPAIYVVLRDDEETPKTRNPNGRGGDNVKDAPIKGRGRVLRGP